VPGARYVVAPPEPCPGWGSSGVINRRGLRDREYDYPKPPGTFRILALGDSYTEGFQFALDEIWPKILERQLNARGDGVKYEVINAGRSAMGTAVEYLYYLNEGRKYDADLVLTLFIPNDFKDNSRELNDRLQPYFTLADGTLELDTRFREAQTYRLKKLVKPLSQNSYLASFTIQVYNQLQAAEAGSAPPPETALSADELEAVAVTRRLFLELAQAVEQDGAQFALVIGTMENETDWDDGPDKARQKDGLLVAEANPLMTEFAESEGLTYLNLRPILQAYSLEHQAYIHGCAENEGGGHWSQTGQAVAADAVYQFLVAEGLIP